ncbi:MAG: B12-binding domain-containing radical SAM protein, partial [Flavobacteriales bacterium]
MKILLLNPTHLSIGSRMAYEHLPPLGLISIGGPLIDDGHDVELLDADYSNMPFEKIIDECIGKDPDLLLMGHSGSTSAQPIINRISERVKELLPKVKIIIGGVFPTYHWKEILEDQPSIDLIVIGEGEEVMQNLATTLALDGDLNEVHGIAHRESGKPVKT